MAKYKVLKQERDDAIRRAIEAERLSMKSEVDAANAARDVALMTAQEKEQTLLRVLAERQTLEKRLDAILAICNESTATNRCAVASPPSSRAPAMAEQRCPYCSGSGESRGGNLVATCFACKGTGIAPTPASAELIRCDYGDKCPGHASPDDRPCGYDPRDYATRRRVGRPPASAEKTCPKCKRPGLFRRGDGTLACSWIGAHGESCDYAETGEVSAEKGGEGDDRTCSGCGGGCLWGEYCGKCAHVRRLNPWIMRREREARERNERALTAHRDLEKVLADKVSTLEATIARLEGEKAEERRIHGERELAYVEGLSKLRDQLSESAAECARLKAERDGLLQLLNLAIIVLRTQGHGEIADRYQKARNDLIAPELAALTPAPAGEESGDAGH